jgi:hypothetical protein
MSEETKVTGLRLSAGTVEVIERLAKAEGVGKAELVELAVANYDREPIVLPGDEPELPDDASVTVLIPKDKDMLVDAIGNLIASCKAYIHTDDIWKGFIWARHEFQTTLPEFKAAEKMRAEFDARHAQKASLSYTKRGESLK